MLVAGNRLSSRLSVRSFAAMLGISSRTVSKWERAGRRANLRSDSHALLDTALRRADDAARGRFDALLTAGDPGAGRRWFDTRSTARVPPNRAPAYRGT